MVKWSDRQEAIFDEYERTRNNIVICIGKLGFLMICAFGATFLALGTFAALYRDAPASLYLKAGILLLITMRLNW